MKIINLFPGSYGSNCYLVEENGHALIVDPSASASAILRALREDGCTPDAILLTHGHFDHVMSIDTLRGAEPDLKVYVHEADAPMLRDGQKNAFSLFFGQDRAWREADVLLADGDSVTVGGAAFTVVHTPGHSPGSVCYLCESEGILLTGDTLFADNIGRCDLWGGSYALIRQSLKRLRGLDGGLTIYPGHGDSNKLSRALDNTMYI
jgi:glyoxylase-like metal-dependent hydrolase (beta-lactamase superfamily II)